jgi:hypothetical protein
MHNRVITEQAPCVKLWTSSGWKKAPVPIGTKTHAHRPIKKAKEGSLVI